MKKFIIFLIVTMTFFILIGCKRATINPKIIGTTFLQEEKGLIFADFDSVRYAPTIIYTAGQYGIEATLKPTTGMQVTVFTDNIHKEPVFFIGKVTTQQIENYYTEKRSYKRKTASIISGVFAFFFIFLSSYRKKPTMEIRVVDAHGDD